MKPKAINVPFVVTMLFITLGGYLSLTSHGDSADPPPPPIVEIDFSAAAEGVNTNAIKSNPKLTFAIKPDPDKDREVTATVNGSFNSKTTVTKNTANGEIELKGLRQGQGHEVVLSVDGKASLPVRMTYDVTGPMITAVKAVWSAPDGDLILAIEFDEQVKQKSDAGALKDDFVVKQQTDATNFGTEVTIGNAALNGSLDRVELNLGKLLRANYQVTVKPNIVDAFDNPVELPVTREFPVNERPVAAAPTIEFAETLPETNDGIKLSKDSEINLNVTGVPSRLGQLKFFVNGINQREVATLSISRPISQPIQLTQQGISTISVALSDTVTGSSLSSTQLRVFLDDVGPMLQHVELVASPSLTGTETTLLATFADDDFKEVKPSFFTVKRKGVDTTFTAEDFAPRNAVIEGRTIRLSQFPTPLPAGEYQLEVIGEGSDPLLDKAGNRAGARGSASITGTNQTSIFAVLGERQFGQHVEFTPYAPPTKQPIPEEGFNPGDFVETRVARLFYFRDAHRVAQIINRNIRSFNQAAVTQAERRAESSRDDADNATDERRQKERAAVRAAEKAREAEQELANMQQALAGAQQLENDIVLDQRQLTALENSPVPADPAEQTARTNRINELTQRVNEGNEDLQRNFGSADAVNNLAKQVAVQQQSVANLRDTELSLRDAWNDAQAKESRAVATQFRDEVTAAETDPDTYVAGDMNSEDPVTQCSISVIGEGLIQLRGPIKGINKIRTMINQIDSPVGQIKIGIFTVQVNGEEGDKMEKVVGDAEGNIDLSRFLVNQSLNLLRRAIQSEAAIIAESCELNGHYQVDRDRRYLYGFFGRDFIDELYEMNSEFMFTENKLLSLHSVDTVSFNRAMFILALAKNDVRERIVTRFLESAKTELPDAEFDFRRSSELKPHRTQKLFPPWNLTHLPIKNEYHKEQVIHEAVHRNALQRYHFRNFAGFFDTGFVNPDTMNPMQREFVRLAQIFKARLVAEMELKQRVLERGLIEDRSNDENAMYAVLSGVRDKAFISLQAAYEGMLESTENLQNASISLDQVGNELRAIPSVQEIRNTAERINGSIKRMPFDAQEREPAVEAFYESTDIRNVKQWLAEQQGATWISPTQKENISAVLGEVYVKGQIPNFGLWVETTNNLAEQKQAWEAVGSKSFPAFKNTVLNRDTSISQLEAAYDALVFDLTKTAPGLLESGAGEKIFNLSKELFEDISAFLNRKAAVDYVKDFLTETRAPLDHRKLLNHLIDEQEDKFIELVEGTRSHIAVMDQYLKRLSIALEDDFKVQFYDPAFVRVREAARGRSVNLSQVERTTILTNNRDFAKVDPQATMEFDLPKRQIAIKEAFDAAKALVEDTGALVNDPTFLSAFQMMGGATQPSTVKNLIPGQSQSLDQHNLGHVPPQPQPSPGSALQSLVPEPSIFKMETGTGFQIRPVMQPDGDSAVYDFDYMYTTNIREPVRADEKHIGRIKRHFVHTAVQTGNFELREISRYQVALKVSRTSRGVPLLEDIPILGAAFRPAPSDESSLQQNIIFGQTNIYPTLFDLMGLRWAQQVVDLDHTSLLESEHVIRGRQKSMKDYVFGVASKRVDEFLDIQKQTPSNYRPDFYHQQTLPSPHHPGGYVYPGGVRDPTGNGFERFDRRPPEMQEPPYDRYRHQPAYPELISPQFVPQPRQTQDEILPLGHSQRDLQPRSELGLSEFESLLFRGPNGEFGENRQPRVNDGASVRRYPRRMPAVGNEPRSRLERVRYGEMPKKLQAAATAPMLRSSIDAYPKSEPPRPNAVTPVSFERAELSSGDVRNGRLRPVYR